MRESRRNRRKEVAAENREIRASCEKVGGFVAGLRSFHGSPNEAELAMRGTAILGSPRRPTTGIQGATGTRSKPGMT